MLSVLSDAWFNAERIHMNSWIDSICRYIELYHRVAPLVPLLHEGLPIVIYAIFKNKGRTIIFLSGGVTFFVKKIVRKL